MIRDRSRRIPSGYFVAAAARALAINARTFAGSFPARRRLPRRSRHPRPRGAAWQWPPPHSLAVSPPAATIRCSRFGPAFWKLRRRRFQSNAMPVPPTAVAVRESTRIAVNVRRRSHMVGLLLRLRRRSASRAECATSHPNSLRSRAGSVCPCIAECSCTPVRVPRPHSLYNLIERRIDKYADLFDVSPAVAARSPRPAMP